MILSKTIENKNQIYSTKLTKLIYFLNNQKASIKTQKQLFFFNKTILTKNIKLNDINKIPVNYILNIVLSQTNTFVNVTDVKGNVIISISSGLINLVKFQKRAQPMALLNIFKILLNKSKFLKNNSVALHFKNVKRFHELFFITALKKNLVIKSFQSYNLTPHNGCRPKKIKRIKRRTKRLVLK